VGGREWHFPCLLSLIGRADDVVEIKIIEREKFAVWERPIHSWETSLQAFNQERIMKVTEYMASMIAII
jgi:hypothetical protein